MAWWWQIWSAWNNEGLTITDGRPGRWRMTDQQNLPTYPLMLNCACTCWQMDVKVAEMAVFKRVFCTLGSADVLPQGTFGSILQSTKWNLKWDNWKCSWKSQTNITKVEKINQSLCLSSSWLRPVSWTSLATICMSNHANLFLHAQTLNEAVSKCSEKCPCISVWNNYIVIQVLYWREEHQWGALKHASGAINCPHSMMPLFDCVA